MPTTTTADNPRRINVNETCSILAVNIKTNTSPTANSHYIRIEDGTSTPAGYTAITSLMITGSSPNWYITASITANVQGLVKVEHVSSLSSTAAVYATFYTIAPCRVECCIATLAESGLNCDCNCGKCAEDLERATKVSLLLQGATYLAEKTNPTSADIANAEKLYLKAVQLCEEVCACGC